MTSHSSLRSRPLYRMPAAGVRSGLDFQRYSPLPLNYMNSDDSTYGNESIPPPLPPRSDVTNFNRMSNYNCFSPFPRYSPGMYGGTPFGHYNPYSNYGSYNNFIQLAEESSRPAFESIESVVNIVSSISMMLESTYQAIYGSYGAILGVVDHFARLKDHLAEILSFLALLRGLKYICLKILYFLRLRRENPSIEAAWNTSQGVAESSNAVGIYDKKNSPLPFLVFCGLVFGAPWLIFKLLSKSASQKTDISKYKKVCPAVGVFNFRATRRGDLSFQAGEKLLLLKSDSSSRVPKGWLLACNHEKKVGLIPANYIKVASASRQQVPNTQSRMVNPLIETTAPPPSESNPNADMDLDFSFFRDDTDKDCKADKGEPQST